MTQLLRGETQQVLNGDRNKEKNHIDDWVKHVILLGPAAGDGQKAATNKDDRGFCAKKHVHLKKVTVIYTCMVA